MARSDPIRARILDSAIRAIDAGGEAAVRVRDVCAEAGVAISLLYYRFRSRDDLVVGAQVERYDRSRYRFLEVFRDDIARSRSRDELEQVIDRMLDRERSPSITESRRIRASVLGSAISRPKLAAAIVEADRRFAARHTEVIRPAQDAGWIRTDLDLPALVIWHAAHQDLRLHREIGEPPVDPTEWDRLVARVLRAVVFPAGSSPTTPAAEERADARRPDSGE